ncbi:methylosome subunit pICln [Coccinella septempunctata]|uniref:methylosome subunit pICln n=1 Tax=Coccinella septempunctata TaxID=41139 RepID=UPI001D09362E|nr:methylosome subunit pICln [Coccinella septempunctata]
MVIVTSFLHPESPIRFAERNVRAFLNKKDLGNGTLYISERTLSWQSRDDKGFKVDYEDISLHATTKDPTIYSEECVYVLLDNRLSLPGLEQASNINEDAESSSDDEEKSESNVSELLFIPETSASIMAIYEAISVCQALNPDPQDIDDDEDHLYEDANEDHLYEDADEDMEEFHETEEGDIHAGGDAAVDNLAHNLGQNNISDENYAICHNGNGDIEDEEFEDAD